GAGRGGRQPDRAAGASAPRLGPPLPDDAPRAGHRGDEPAGPGVRLPDRAGRQVGLRPAAARPAPGRPRPCRQAADASPAPAAPPPAPPPPAPPRGRAPAPRAPPPPRPPRPAPARPALLALRSAPAQPLGHAAALAHPRARPRPTAPAHVAGPANPWRGRRR